METITPILARLRECIIITCKMNRFVVVLAGINTGVHFKQTHLPHVPSELITEYLRHLNDIWSQREKRRVFKRSLCAEPVYGFSRISAAGRRSSFSSAAHRSCCAAI